MKKNTKLQNIIFPSVDMIEHWEMFYQKMELVKNHINNSFLFPNKDNCDFATYFNSFSYRKWKTYTNIENLNLQLVLNGKFNIVLVGYLEEYGKIKKYFLDEKTVIATKDEPINVTFPKIDKDYTIVAFELIPLSKDCEIFSGYYYTNIDESLIRDVSISLVTTTFKKEQFIIPNIEMLKKEILNCDESIAKGFDIHVIDNGRTLNPQDYNCEHLTVHPNKNVGGAGGFARGMIETIKQKNPATHVLLMDDDVIIMPEALKRTYNLLSLLKDEYKDHFISGAMLKMEQMNEQHEDIGYIHNDGYYTPKKRTMLLHLKEDVVMNEELLTNPTNSYAAWWYCCTPIKNVRPDNLPLPVFVRGDDVEFSLRNKADIISLNGICIWHMGFTQKFNGAMELYQVPRNSLIIQATSNICNNVDFIPRLKVLFYSEIYRFNYNGASLLLDAIEDFMKGPDFFSTLDGEKMMKEKGKLNDNLSDIKDFENIFVDLGRVYDNPPMTKKERLIYQLTNNGHRFIPSFFLKKDIGVSPQDWCVTPAKNYM
ncbi:MAG: glycosyltransferase, partial [Spirochaetales bacterium]|nr:glycosyltransferase [Spirochaetales bacterium]